MRFHHLLAVSAFGALIAAGPALGGSRDYYIHAEAYNPLGEAYQPAYITIDWLDGEVLSPPDEACGMRFEGDPTLDWYSDNLDEHDSIPASGSVAEVWLPSDDCGAWQGVVVETADDLYSPQYDKSGYITTYSRGYWINSSHQKLVYLFQPCHPMPACILGGQLEFVANGWSDSVDGPILKLRAAYAALKNGGTGTAALSFVTRAADALTQAARTTTERVQTRRTVHTGTLETPMRQLEDAALRRISQARDRVSECANELRRGNVVLASRACDAALHETLNARVALDTGDEWIDWKADTTSPALKSP